MLITDLKGNEEDEVCKIDLWWSPSQSQIQFVFINLDFPLFYQRECPTPLHET